jgi:uncharacterized membrane protein
MPSRLGSTILGANIELLYFKLFLTFMGLRIVNIFLSMANKMQRCIILFIIFNAVHVSSGFSAHHQELKSVHAASGIGQTCLLLPLAWMSWDYTDAAWTDLSS